MKTRNNTRSLLNMFDRDNPDRVGKILKALGLGIANLILGLIVVAQVIRVLSGDSEMFTAVMTAASVGWFVVALLSVVLGIHYLGRDAGKKNFISSGWYAFGKTFLYVLVPCLIITCIIILWAVATKQSAFV